jgi:hypothetical protein
MVCGRNRFIFKKIKSVKKKFSLSHAKEARHQKKKKKKKSHPLEKRSEVKIGSLFPWIVFDALLGVRRCAFGWKRESS